MLYINVHELDVLSIYCKIKDVKLCAYFMAFPGMENYLVKIAQAEMH